MLVEWRYTWRTRLLRRVLQPFAIEPINPFMAEMKASDRLKNASRHRLEAAPRLKANVKCLSERGLGVLDVGLSSTAASGKL